MAVKRKAGAPKRRPSAATLRGRLQEAEATLEAIRTGQVDALVVSGPRGAQTLTIDGASHPYFVLLNAMGDGAVLLEPGGAILFGNRAFGNIAGVPLATLRGSLFQRLVAPAARAGFEKLLQEGGTGNVAREFLLTTRNGSATPVTIALSTLPLDSRPDVMSDDGDSVLMAIVTNLSYRKASELARARLLERLIAAEDDERRRISRELHDETGQSLTALLVGLRVVADMSVSSEARAAALRLRDIAAQTVDDVGRLARGLHPAILDDLGLAAAARRYVNDYVRSFGTTMNFVSGDLDSPRLAPLVAATMYRLLQETLTNVARHARATTIRVELKRHESAMELLVRDDGVGFDLNGTVESGLGLHGMRERATLLGGSIQIESRPGQGTVVRAHIPVSPLTREAPRRARQSPSASAARPSARSRRP